MNILHPKRSRTGVALRRGLAASCWCAFLLAVTVLLFARRAAPAQQSSPTPGMDNASSGNAENGKKIFVSDGCYECHGREGQGSTATGGTRIGPPQIPLEAFVSYVRQPALRMPPYTTKAMPDKDLADIYAFLKTIPLPPQGKDIPLLNK